MTTNRPSIKGIINHAEANHLIDHGLLNRKQNKVLKDISRCHTPELGFHSDQCESCGETTLYYNSCRNSCCPECMAVDREIWADKQLQNTFNTRYFHIVFTLPDTLNSLCLLDPKFMYGLLFSAVSSTLLTLSADPKYLGARPGFVCVLHTWGQNLSLHPHLHTIITGGGITNDDEWKTSRKKFFIPVKVLSRIFRGKFLSGLKSGFNRSKLKDPIGFQKVIDECYSKDWVVYAKKPMDSPRSAVKYLSRYTNRIAISNGRILSSENGKVSFRYKDYKDHNKLKVMTLDEKEFIRRYLLHILPPNFVRIRYYGILAPSVREKLLEKVRLLTNTPAPPPLVIDRSVYICRVLKRDVSICPHCHRPLHPLKE